MTSSISFSCYNLYRPSTRKAAAEAAGPLTGREAILALPKTPSSAFKHRSLTGAMAPSNLGALRVTPM